MKGVKIAHCSEPRLTDGVRGDENSAHPAWVQLPKGEQTIELTLDGDCKEISLHLGTLNYAPEGVVPPSRVAVYGSTDGTNYELLHTSQPYVWPNNRHDAWVQELHLGHHTTPLKQLRLVLTCPSKCYVDELTVTE